jgi:hypothetical protein
VSPTSGGVVRWAAGPLCFQLTTDDPAVRSIAATVFRPWAIEDERQPGRTLIWRIDRIHDGGGAPEWRVRSAGDDDIRTSSAERAVGIVEVSAITRLLESPALLVHAALVAWDSRGVLLAGRGEAGKSTLACALWARGATLLGDDVAIVDPVTGAVWAGPRRVSLRAPSRAILGDALYERAMHGPSSVDFGDSRVFHPDEIEPYPRSAPVSLSAIVFLARLGSDAPPARLEPIPPAHALLALVPYTNHRSAETLGEAIRALTPLADRVPAFDLGRGSLSAMAEVVEALAGSGVAT